MRNYLRALGLGILLGMMPAIVSAKDLVIGDETDLNFPSLYEITVDSVPKIRSQDDKKKKPDTEKDEKEDPKTVDVKTRRPDIKEVPKSRPKLRPGVVTDRVKIKRPPVRINRPGKVLHLGL